MAKLARLEKHLSAGTTGLILFDALNGYLHPNNPEKVRFLATRNIIGNLQRLLEGARKVGMTAFYPSGAHAPDGSDSVDRLTDTDMDLAPGGSAGMAGGTCAIVISSVPRRSGGTACSGNGRRNASAPAL